MEKVYLPTLDPQHFVTYRNDGTRCFCQVRLDSGERILISAAKGEIKLMKLGFGGTVPLKTIAKLNAAQLARLLKLFFADSSYPLLHPLDLMALLIAGAPSVAELKMFFAADREAQSVVVTVAVDRGRQAVDELRRQQREKET
jgi:hypothetical protein